MMMINRIRMNRKIKNDYYKTISNDCKLVCLVYEWIIMLHRSIGFISSSLNGQNPN